MIARRVRLLLIAACFVAANAAAQTYRVVDLATLAQGYATVVRGPNSAGAGSGSGILDGTQGAGRADAHYCSRSMARGRPPHRPKVTAQSSSVSTMPEAT